MIANFPEFYEDELVYSALCRFYVHTVIGSRTAAKRLIYGDTTARIDPYSIGHIRKNIEEAMTRYVSRRELIIEHTMYPYLVTFEYSGKQLCERSLLGYKSSHGCGMLNKQLRYCPICAKKEAEQYGESYYHRKHQLMTACTIHHVMLNAVDVAIGKRQLVALIPLEIVRTESCIVADAEDIRYSEYVEQFLSIPFSLRQKLNIQLIMRYLPHSIIEREKYNKYGSLDKKVQIWIKEKYKDIISLRCDAILQLGYKLGISPEDLFIEPRRQ